MVFKNFGSQKFWSDKKGVKKNMASKKFWSDKKGVKKKIWHQKNFGSTKNFEPWKFMVHEKILV